MPSFFRSLFVRRAWFHNWREHDDLHRQCTVCGQREERDAEGDWLSNGPGPWWVAVSGKRSAHFLQSAPRPAPASYISTDGACELVHDEPAAM